MSFLETECLVAGASSTTAFPRNLICRKSARSQHLFFPLIPIMAPSEDEEDDYMSMVIEEPTQKESFTQRKRREQREVPSHIHIPALRPWRSRITNLSRESRPKLEAECPPKLNEQLRKLPVVMRLSRRVHWTPRTRGSR